MLKIRLYRVGKKKQPFYRIVIIPEKRSAKGRYIEKIGFYNPHKKPHQITLNKERLDHWLSHGAKPSDTVQNLLFEAGFSKIQIKKTITKKKGKKELKPEKPERIEAPGQEKQEGSLMEEGVEKAIASEKEKEEANRKIQEVQKEKSVDKSTLESKENKKE